MQQIPIQAWWILVPLAAVWLVAVGFTIYCALKGFGHPTFESHWGGLGRGLGGWSVNWTLVLSLIALVLTCSVAAIGFETISWLFYPPKPNNAAAIGREAPTNSTQTSTTAEAGKK